MHKDANGSVRSITNVSGTEVKCYHYDPFGNIVAVTGSDTGNTRNTRRYAGRDWDDETDLVYMVARYYDPRFGRFTSPDPEPTIMSPYTYVLNNPVSFTDPTGHAARCGGAYQPNFNSKTWLSIMYGSYIWNQYAIPQERDPHEPKEYIWGNTDWAGSITANNQAELFGLEMKSVLYEIMTQQILMDIVNWLRTNIPDFRLWEGLLKKDYKLNYIIEEGTSPLTSEGGIGTHPGSLGSFGFLSGPPQIWVCEFWPASLGMSQIKSRIAEAFLHEVAECTGIAYFGYSKPELGSGAGPAHDLAVIYVNQYIGQGFFDSGNVGKNMDWWWEQHSVMNLATLASAEKNFLESRHK